jgi:hypothetical protein
MKTKWHSFWSLSPAERWLAVQALGLLSFTKFALHFLSVPNLQFVLAASLKGIKSGRQRFGDAPLQAAWNHARIVAMAARNLPFSVTCLPKSIVLWYLLKRSGVDSELQIGMRQEAGKLAAHAWVECLGQVVGDPSDVREQFATFERVVFNDSVSPTPASEARSPRSVSDISAPTTATSEWQVSR